MQALLKLNSSNSLTNETQHSKKRKFQVDMSVIPSCLIEEGFTNEESIDSSEVETKIPQYLLCPVCKDILFTPVMLSCGHTMCRDCIVDNNTVTRSRWENDVLICPVCRLLQSDTRPISNFVLNELLKEQYPKLQAKRREERATLQLIKKKLAIYMNSNRSKEIAKEMKIIFSKKKQHRVDSLIKQFAELQWKQPISESEVKYFLASFIPVSIYMNIGSYIVEKQSPSNLVIFLEDNNSEENLKWSSILLVHRSYDVLPQVDPHTPLTQQLTPPPDMTPMPLPPNMTVTPPPWTTTNRGGSSSSRVMETHNMYKRLGALNGIDIGEELNLEKWRNAAAFWINDLDLDKKHFEEMEKEIVDDNDDQMEDQQDIRTMSTIEPRNRWNV